MAEKKTTPEFKEAFVRMLGTLPNVTAVCRLMGIDVSNIRAARKNDPEFDRQVLEAIEEGYDMIEEEARRRAVDGVKEPVFFKGEVVGEVTRYSDTLLQFILKAQRKKFNPQAHVDVGDKKVTMVFEIGGDE